jgi:DNA-nicking Smr family endonuclease
MATRRSTTPVSAADQDAFRQAVKDVTPLKNEPRIRPTPPPKRRRPTPSADSRPASLSDMPIVGEETEPQGVDAVLSFQRAGVRTQVMRRLRRGLYAIEDELDLHGLTQAVARERLAEFIDACRSQGLRCVRIIHGKGHRSPGRGPVLKTAVNLWLKRHLDVTAFASAKPIDGGTGALYVLLHA